MTAINFYSSNFPEYYWQKGHYNLGNKIVHSDMYKKALNPIRARYDYKPNSYSQMPYFKGEGNYFWEIHLFNVSQSSNMIKIISLISYASPYFLGHVPQFSWVYGNLDYSFNKHHRYYQAHDDWYPDRKAKTLGVKNGGFMDPTGKQSKYLTLQHNFIHKQLRKDFFKIPRGCYREIRKYQLCAAKSSKEACINDKINIMEVCPDHVLEGLREKKKHNQSQMHYLRAEVIDNETYKRAMQVSDYNKDRSVSDLKLKTWDYGKGGNLRSDSLWQDDRYNPTKYSHPHRYDNVNFPEQEYKDIFGGTMGHQEAKEQEFYKIELLSGQSKASEEFIKEKRAHSAEPTTTAPAAEHH